VKDWKRSGSAFVLALVLLVSGSRGVPAQATAPPVPVQRTMSVTVDDLPAVPATDLETMRSITVRLLATLSAHGVKTVAFVNGNKLEPKTEREARLALLRRWVEAGHDLGNHTFSHLDLQTTPLDEYEADVVRGEVAIREAVAPSQDRPRWFRHPYTHTGPTAQVRQAFEAFLASRGYAVAPFSVENADYVFDRARRDAERRGDDRTAARLLEAYVEHTLDAVAYCEDLARDTFGRDVPQILLVHANGTNATVLGDVLDRLSLRGYHFVTLGQALADPAWQTPDEYVGAKGLSWLHRFRLSRGLPVRPETEPDPPRWVLDLYRAAQAR
jgi:peptidoglycan-N-acetylglucosamine deacetylase